MLYYALALALVILLSLIYIQGPAQRSEAPFGSLAGLGLGLYHHVTSAMDKFAFWIFCLLDRSSYLALCFSFSLFLLLSYIQRPSSAQQRSSFCWLAGWLGGVFF